MRLMSSRNCSRRVQRPHVAAFVFRSLLRCCSSSPVLLGSETRRLPDFRLLLACASHPLPIPATCQHLPHCLSRCWYLRQRHPRPRWRQGPRPAAGQHLRHQHRSVLCGGHGLQQQHRLPAHLGHFRQAALRQWWLLALVDSRWLALVDSRWPRAQQTCLWAWPRARHATPVCWLLVTTSGAL